jgi:ParB family chromosome partitioning protein
MAAVSKGLGRGLGALFQNDLPDATKMLSQAENPADTKIMAIRDISPNPGQPRKDFDQEALNELADSIRAQGLLQPILVRPVSGHLREHGAKRYEIVAGERRWRAAQLAGLTELPVIVKEISDTQALALALIENLQREDLNPLEEAVGMQRLKDEFGLSQEELANQLGKSRSAVANSLRLLNLPENAQQNLRAGKISPGHARALLAVDNPATSELIRKRILEQKLSVREAEALAFEAKEKTDGKQPSTATTGLPASKAAKQDYRTEINQPASQSDNHTHSQIVPQKESLAVAPLADGQEQAVPGNRAKGIAKKPQSVTLLALQSKLTLTVKLPVKFSGKTDKGRLSISYSSREELERLLEKLGVTGGLE